MNRYVKGQTYGQRLRVLVDLLKLYGRLSPDAAERTVIGMTASTVVVSTADRRVVALAAGETMDGITVHHIDVGKGVAQTNFGELWYAKKEK